jgi:uncharacterized protein
MTLPLIVVIDTSVWISGVFYRGNPFRVLQAWRDEKFDVVYTSETLVETARRLHDKAIQFGVNPSVINEWIEFIRVFAQMVQPTGAGQGVSRDPKDDKFLDAAVSGKAAYLVSSDKDLQVLGEYEGVKIVSPRRFLEILSELNDD